MKLKTMSRRTLRDVLFVGAIISLVPILYLFWDALNLPLDSKANLEPTIFLEDYPVFPSKEQQVVRGLPVRLKIPKINVDTAVESVGLTPKGEVGVPKNFSNSAWFNMWPKPGDSGNAVITGHYGIKDGKPSVFDNLHKLRKGDKLIVEDDKGEAISFAVREIKRYNPKADAIDVFVSSDNNSHLNIITCEGIYNKVSKSYPKRLVVFTDKIE